MDGPEQLLGCGGPWALSAFCPLLICGGFESNLRSERVTSPWLGDPL
jgi:hypothetical protein